MASSVSLNAASDPLAELPTVLVTTTTTVTSPTATEEARVQDVNGTGSPVADEPPRPQAGPLPRKRGEIGFQEGLHDVPLDEGQASSSTTSLPERHPADREIPPSSSELSPPPDEQPPRSPSRAESTNTANTTGKRSIISFFKPKRIPTYFGLRVTTLAIFLFQLALFGGTIAGWVLTVQWMHKTGSSSSSGSSDSDGSGDSTQTNVFSSTSAQIFIHVAFGIVCLAELIFLERTLFRLRAERYGHVHPGEILPSARTRASQERDMAIAFAPWNRPPLPTYAAALAQSGLGTGDVEDNIIAIPPPPAYGNTRGSTLLLRGFLSDALRAQRPRSNGSVQSSLSVGRSERSRANRSGEGGEDEQDRPKSYVSTDSEWEARLDADRALILEETLSRLEEGTARSSSRAAPR
ncbi:hypothetical protein BD310DRAFT_920208 [Dichomitus squalens]|uniref:Uncharacterized protein n=1 Tax=Dichomitus squalens TaxID=114155 RepID=A0A4Q9Q438_9APHY|nr:hypothetical protein BD310DRAFT_920208 [Dichomitus squalens]